MDRFRRQPGCATAAAGRFSQWMLNQGTSNVSARSTSATLLPCRPHAASLPVMPIAADPFLATLSLIGVVIIVAALLSGLIERSGVPQVGVLLALGAVLGPYGLGLIDTRLDSPVLRAVSTLSLALVLFTDALSLDLAEIRRHVRLTLLVLGPGTLLSAVLVALMAGFLLGLPWPAAAVLGAALASTDPVLLRGLLRRHDLPGTARLALRLESGLNDVVLLPIVLVAMAFHGEQPPIRMHQAPVRHGLENLAVDDHGRQSHALHLSIRARLEPAAGAQLKVHRSLVAVFRIPFGTRDRFPDGLGRSLDIDLEHLGAHARLRLGRHLFSSRSAFNSTSAETNGSAYLRVQRS